MRYPWLLISTIAVMLIAAGMFMPVGCGTGSGSADRGAEDPAGSRNVEGEGWQAVGLAFDASSAMQHVERLSLEIGPRPAGSQAESEAAAYIEGAFAASGYNDVVEQAFPSIGNDISRNIYVEDIGTRPEWVVVVGAHYDSVGGTGSPGANDNASGVGVVLELARVFREVENVPTLLFVAFASEEIPEGYDEDEVTFGSDYMVEHLGEIKGEVIGMFNLDMVGVGDSLDVNTLKQAPPVLTWLFATLAGLVGVQVTLVEDPGWSDNVAFEDQGIPSLYLEWVPDYNYHTPQDTFDQVDGDLVGQSGRLVEGFLGELDAEVCKALELQQE